MTTANLPLRTFSFDTFTRSLLHIALSIFFLFFHDRMLGVPGWKILSPRLFRRLAGEIPSCSGEMNHA